MKNRDLTRTIIICLCCMLCVVSCKTPQKVVTESNIKEQKDIANDITSGETSSINEAVQRSVEKLKSGKYGIIINRVEYDTDKPADIITGKPPVKSDSNITITGQEESREIDNTTTRRQETASSELSDRTIDKSKVQAGDKAKTEREFSRIEILAVCAVAALLIILAIYIIRKLKK